VVGGSFPPSPPPYPFGWRGGILRVFWRNKGILLLVSLLTRGEIMPSETGICRGPINYLQGPEINVPKKEVNEWGPSTENAREGIIPSHR